MIYVSTVHKLGVENEKSVILNLYSFKNSKIENTTTYCESDYNIKKEVLNIEKELNDYSEKNRINIIRSQNDKVLSGSNKSVDKIKNMDKIKSIDKLKNMDENQCYIQLNKNILFLHSLYTEFLSIYIFYFIPITSLILIISRKKDMDIQENDGKWRYQCPLDKLDLALNITEFIIILYLTRISIITRNYIYVFKCTK
eukprot:jgi/Orpsp1_1/1175635/evm.model.c7180000054635.1